MPQKISAQISRKFNTFLPRLRRDYCFPHLAMCTFVCACVSINDDISISSHTNAFLFNLYTFLAVRFYYVFLFSSIRHHFLQPLVCLLSRVSLTRYVLSLKMFVVVVVFFIFFFFFIFGARAKLNCVSFFLSLIFGE